MESQSDSETEIQCLKKAPGKSSQKKWRLEMLSISYRPDRVVGRLEEQKTIDKFVRDAIMGYINSKVLCTWKAMQKYRGCLGSARRRQWRRYCTSWRGSWETMLILATSTVLPSKNQTMSSWP